MFEILEFLDFSPEILLAFVITHKFSLWVIADLSKKWSSWRQETLSQELIGKVSIAAMNVVNLLTQGQMICVQSLFEHLRARCHELGSDNGRMIFWAAINSLRDEGSIIISDSCECHVPGREVFHMSIGIVSTKEGDLDD